MIEKLSLNGAHGGHGRHGGHGGHGVFFIFTHSNCNTPGKVTNTDKEIILEPSQVKREGLYWLRKVWSISSYGYGEQTVQHTVFYNLDKCFVILTQ